MNRVLYIKTAVKQKDAITGIVSGLGVLAFETAYIVFAVLFGINLFRRGSYYQLFKKAGEGKKTNSQTANVLGTLIYAVLVFALIPVVKAVALKIFER